MTNILIRFTLVNRKARTSKPCWIASVRYAAGDGLRLADAVARYLALWMSYEDTARVAALRILLSAKKDASNLRMERARANHLDRLKARTPAGVAAADPRDTFGAESIEDAFVAGDN